MKKISKGLEEPESMAPILVATDFSPVSRLAVDWAIQASHRWHCPLVVLHVVHDPESAPGYYMKSKKRKKHLTRMEDAAQIMMDEFMQSIRGECPVIDDLTTVEARLVVGLPVYRILEVANEIGARQIVLGCVGRTGLPRLLLGSNALRVAQLAPVPVTLVKNPKS
ncbi:MAG: universal stress protein [Thermoanaerobaculia bacterium]|nr:universal stress protein [Thermoanaerobaculia bacterium]